MCSCGGEERLEGGFQGSEAGRLSFYCGSCRGSGAERGGAAAEWRGLGGYISVEKLCGVGIDGFGVGDVMGGRLFGVQGWYVGDLRDGGLEFGVESA